MKCFASKKCYGGIIINKIAFALIIVMVSLLYVSFVVAHSNENGKGIDIEMYGPNHVKFEDSLLNGHHDSQSGNVVYGNGVDNNAMSDSIHSHVEGTYSCVL